MATDDGGSDMTRKHINIRDRHAEEIDDRNLNLSGFVRDRLDEWSERD